MLQPRQDVAREEVGLGGVRIAGKECRDGVGTFGGIVRWAPRDDNRYFGVDLRKDF